MDAAPCESAAPATKSILDLAKVLRLPGNLYLTLRKCCACHAIQTLRNLRTAVPMGPSLRLFRDRLRTGVAAEVVCAQPGSPIHAQRQRFLHLAIPSSQRVDAAPCESAAPATKSILDLAKALRLPRNLYLTFTHSANVFCILPSPSSQRVDAAPCESAAPATKSILDLAKVLRLPRNLYLTLRKCCACHAIQTLRNLRAAVPMGPSPRPFRDRLRTGVAAEVVCAQSGSPIHAQRQRFLHLAIPQLAESGRSTLRKCCACHEIDT